MLAVTETQNYAETYKRQSFFPEAIDFRAEEPLLEVKRLTKYYKSVHALDDVTFTVRKGEFV